LLEKGCKFAKPYLRLSLVYLTFDDQFHYVVEPSNLNGDESLVVGGQEGIYPAKLYVDKDTSMKAARIFSELGAMEKSVIWERDGVAESV
jgi:hypothetical protein